MKKVVYSFILTLLLSLGGCSDDSRITGKWQLTRIDCLDREEYTDSVYYNFHHEVCKIQLRRQHDIYTTGYLWGMYTLFGDSLTISLNTNVDLSVVSPVLGWRELVKKYKIEELGRTKLTLSCRDTVYYFRKF